MYICRCFSAVCMCVWFEMKGMDLNADPIQFETIVYIFEPLEVDMKLISSCT